MIFHLDFETRSPLPLETVGLDNYAKSAEVLLMAYAMDDSPVEVWEPHLNPMPVEVKAAIIDPSVRKSAWNAGFERTILREVLKIEVPIEQFDDPSITARYLSIPGKLESAGTILGLSAEKAKIQLGEMYGITTTKEAERLKQLFCYPAYIGGEETLFGVMKTEFRDWKSDPRDWELFKQYCFTPNHTLLDENLLWRPASDFKVGDVVLGFDENGPRRKFRRSTIEVISYEDCLTFEVRLESGKIFHVTKDHQWLTCQKRSRCGSNKSSNKLRWIQTNQLESYEKNHGSGYSRIPRLIAPWESEKSYEAGWLAGILDGEGSYSSNHLSVGQNPGVVQENIRQELSKYAKISSRLTNSDGRKCETIHIKGHKLETLRTLGRIRPKRLLEKVNFDTLGQVECRDIRDAVVSIKPSGIRKIIKIQTSTGTIVVDGYPMHNCKQDVIAERALMHKMSRFPLPEIERRLWFLDQKINDRGMPTNLDFVHRAIRVTEKAQNELRTRLLELTRLENPNSVPQLLSWLTPRGYPFKTLGKVFVQRALVEDYELDPECREVLVLRQQSAKTSTEKYKAILDRVSADHRVRNGYSFLGAPKTGRWSASGVQLHNLPRPAEVVEKDPSKFIDLIMKEDYDAIKALASPMDVVTSCIRASFQAPKGSYLAVCDLAAIEPHVLAWIARCKSMLDVLASGKNLYISFAAGLHHKKYEEVTKLEKQNAKPPVLGCFGEDTPVLTDRGWVPIVAVRKTDRVFDGLQFVNHCGIIYRGEKQTINLHGIGVTPDHQIQTGTEEWTSAWAINQNSRIAKQALDLASGKLSEAITRGSIPPTFVSVLGATRREWLTNATSKTVGQNRVSHAPTKDSVKNGAVYIYSSILLEKTSTESPTFTTQSFHAVEEKDTAVIDTGVAGFPASSPMYTILSDMSEPSPGGTTRTFKLIVLTTTETTPEETFGSSLQKPTTEIKPDSDGLPIRTKQYPQASFGNVSALRIAIKGRSQERFETGFPQNKLSPISLNAKEPTFDVLNAGPRNRYMILTGKGPLIVHNCGYGLSGGEEALSKDSEVIRTGLWGYAKSLGVEMTRDESHTAVKTYRDQYWEIVQLWKDFDNAVKKVMSGNGPVKLGNRSHPMLMEKIRKVLRILLPSGRALHYMNPRMESRTRTYEGREYQSESLVYDGLDQKTRMWGPIHTYGSRLVENVTQAIARDVLGNGMLLADERGIEIVGHAHDELITVFPNSVKNGLSPLRECMKKQPSWAPDLPLDAAGFESVYYRKE